MFRKRTVMRDQRNIEAQFQSDWTRIAKATSGNQRHAHALFARVFDRQAITFRNMPARIEESPVEIESQKTDRHKDDQGSIGNLWIQMTTRDIMRAPPSTKQNHWR